MIVKQCYELYSHTYIIIVCFIQNKEYLSIYLYMYTVYIYCIVLVIAVIWPFTFLSYSLCLKLPLLLNNQTDIPLF